VLRRNIPLPKQIAARTVCTCISVEK